MATWRQILLHRLSLSTKLKFRDHFEKEKENGLPFDDGGDHNTTFLKFEDEHQADVVMDELKTELNKMKKYKATKTKDGHIELTYATKHDTWLKKNNGKL